MFSNLRSAARLGQSAKSWAFALLAFALPASMFAANYYVSTTGNDLDAGTLAAPFASVMKAQSVATAGDTIYVRGGTYSTFTIAATDSNYNYVHRLSKNGVNYAAYPGETPVFNFSSIPTNLRVCGFHVTGSGITVSGFQVTGVPVGSQKQSECFRIDGSAAQVDFYDCVAHDNAANGFYFTNRSRGSCTRCDSYNNIGTNGDAIGNTDGFGAHGNGVVFRYCRSWNNSDDGFDCISSPGANTFDHCWAYNMRAGGDSNGFKIGGFGADPTTIPPSPVPVHTVMYCLSANNGSHGFYANHQPGQSAVWTHNTAYNNSAGNFDMLERLSDMSADIPGYREVLHNNLAYVGTAIKDDNNPPEATTNNSWTLPVTVDASDFQSVDASQMVLPRSAGGNMPFITFMHLTPGSDLVGLGCFDPAPAAPTGVAAGWVSSSEVDVSWTASPDATYYNVKRATASGGPYTTIATRVMGTTYNDTTATGGGTYFYVVSALNDVSYDESVSTEAGANFPTIGISSVSSDTGTSSTDRITSDATLVLSGTAGSNASVDVTLSGIGLLGTVAADAAGHWTFDYSGTSLADGVYTFQITATDPVSHTHFLSDPFVVTIDTTAPGAPTITSAGSTPLVINGTAEPQSVVSVTLDGTVDAGSTVAGPGGIWTLTYSGSIFSGVHTLTAIATDVAGNSSGASVTYTLNTAVATPTIAAAQSDAGQLANGAVTSDGTLTFSGTAGPGDTVTLARVGFGNVGSVVADGTGIWTVDATGTVLPEGLNQFTATGSNASGSSPTSPVFNITVDSVAPAVQSIVRQSPSAATITSAVTTVVFRVTFSEAVGGVAPGGFILSSTGTAAGTVSGVSAAAGTVIDVTVSNLSGEGTLRLDVPSSGSGIKDTAGNPVVGYSAGDVFTRVISVPGNGTWIRSASGGLWSDAANWQDAVIPSGSTNSANFATLDLTADNVVHLDSPRTVNSMTFSDTNPASAANWILDNNGSAGNVLTLGGTVPTITVNTLGTASIATISAGMVGTTGLTKAGSGTLILAGPNSVSGSLSTLAGNLRINSGSSMSPSTIAVNSGARIDVAGGTLTASGTATITGATNTVLAIGNGTASLATVTFTNASGGTFRIDGGNVTVNTVTIPRSSDATVSYATGFVVTGGTSTVGSVSLGTGNSNGAMSVEGGALTVIGPVIVGAQTTGGRGGGLRVTGGSFTSLDGTDGIVLGKKNGANANNVTSANFLGGVSTVEKLTLGFDATVNAGSGTIALAGGELYLGAGGIEQRATIGYVATVSLTSGVLGAKANWSSSVPMTLNAGNTVSLRAADAAFAPHDITLSGALGGPGGLLKSGAGNLTLNGANTFGGDLTINDGTVTLAGSLASGGAVQVNSGGTLTGTGTTNKPISLNAGGRLAPGLSGTGILNGTTLTWVAGGQLAINADAVSNQLTLTGALTRSGSGAYQVTVSTAGLPASGTTLTLATFASTNFTVSDLSFIGPAGLKGGFVVSPTSLQFVVGPTDDAGYNAWASGYRLPAGKDGFADDPDGDGTPNLLEYVLGQDPTIAAPAGFVVAKANIAGIEYPTLTFVRRHDLGTVTVNVLVSTNLNFTSDLGSVEVSATSRGDGFDTMVVRSAVSLAVQPRQFLKLNVTAP